MSEKFFDGDAIAVSRYYQRFLRLRRAKNHGDQKELMMLKGDNVLVERLPKVEMKTKSGLIIGQATTHKNTVADSLTDFGLVLMVGPGQLFEDGTTQECDARPGDVILLPQSTYWYGMFGHINDYEPYSIGRLRDGQIPLWFNDYKTAFEVLNG